MMKNGHSSSLFNLDSPGQRTARARLACSVQRTALAGAQRCLLAHDAARFPPWPAVYQQMQRWLRAGVFEAMVHDLRVLLREYAGREGQPSAMVLDSRTLQSTPESGSRAGYDGAKRRKGSKVHAAVDTLGHLLALHVTRPMSKTARRSKNWRKRYRSYRSERRTGVCGSRLHGRPCKTSRPAQVSSWSGQAHRGQARLRLAAAALGGGTQLRVGCTISPPGTRLRALGSTLAGFHFLAFACLMLHRIIPLVSDS